MRRETRYYHRKRRALVGALGGKCAFEDTPGHVCSGDLHIDHVDGRDWEMRKLSSHSRITRMCREHEAGVRLRLLCASANARDGNAKKYYGRGPSGALGAPDDLDDDDATPF